MSVSQSQNYLFRIYQEGVIAKESQIVYGFDVDLDISQCQYSIDIHKVFTISYKILYNLTSL